MAGRKEVRSSEPRGLRGVAKEVYEKVSTVKEKFLEAMEDDFNTALALGYLHDLTRMLNRVLGDKGFRKDPAAAALLSEGRSRLQESGRILGLFQQSPTEFFTGQRKRYLQAKGLQEKEIQDLIARREAARKEKIGSGRMKSAPRPHRWGSSWKMVRRGRPGDRHEIGSE